MTDIFRLSKKKVKTKFEDMIKKATPDAVRAGLIINWVRGPILLEHSRGLYFWTGSYIVHAAGYKDTLLVCDADDDGWMVR